MLLLTSCSNDNDSSPVDNVSYQIWASDQSNSVIGAYAAGTRGSFLWDWESAALETLISGGTDATPLGCLPVSQTDADESTGPCDLLAVFPQSLVEIDADGNTTGQTLADLNGFGRLHGMLADPDNRYVTANIFAPTGGFVGDIDTRTREALALYRVTGTNVGRGTDVRSVHMSFWSEDGASILVANLNGKVLERIEAATLDGSHVHTVDRVANVVEVFDREFNRSTYDLTSADGRGTGDGPSLSIIPLKVLVRVSVSLN